MNAKIIPFNRAYLSTYEEKYLREALLSRNFSGDGVFTKKCHHFFEQRYAFSKALLTTSCTDALEMCALLLNIQAGDEVILPSYTFVSTANAFLIRGAKLVFADSELDHPNMDIHSLESLITPKTKAIVPVHYAGMACDMNLLRTLAKEHSLAIIEDAAQAIEAQYNGKYLGTLGDLGAFSFHITKNIVCGEGGLLAINDPRFKDRAEVLREKGTNRSAFFRGEVDKYTWVDVGSSFLPSDLNAAVLWAQLENIDNIQNQRMAVWNRYHEGLGSLLEKGILLPLVKEGVIHNAHTYYLVCRNLDQRTRLIGTLKEFGIQTTFHYISLHSSPFFKDKHDGRTLPQSDRFTDHLLRLPLYPDLHNSDQDMIIEKILHFFKFES
ncbi:MAG TPA: dTDP-4-amino-4,6-dideoxygalactose transaminase [Pseudobdellovibrionaceae bacterium]|nr:dTDP-4-amino-4,6-dideoxygalactose transaminase [Pseudobdellovibrionaceae bacterium]